MLKPRVMFSMLVFIAAVAVLGGCSGLPYVRPGSGLDAKQTKIGVMAMPNYHVLGKTLPGFEPAANSALEHSLAGAVTGMGGSAKALAHEDFKVLLRAFLAKTGGMVWTSSRTPAISVNSETEIGDFKELFKKHDLDVLLMIVGPVFITLPAKMYEMRSEEITSAFYGNTIDINGSRDSERLQMLAILPDGRFAFASDIEEFAVYKFGSTKKARLIDESLRNEMMTTVYRNYLSALSTGK